MPRALRPDDDRREPAYRVPWLVDRRYDTHPVITNAGDEVLEFVRIFTHHPDAEPDLDLWGAMAPRDAVELCLCDVDPDRAIVTLAWYRPGGGEYVWHVVI